MHLEALFHEQWCEVVAIYAGETRHQSLPNDDAMFVLPEGLPGMLVEIKNLPRIRVVHDGAVVGNAVRRDLTETVTH